jgi:hypothetical protein
MYMEVMTLERLPFRLGLGRVMDAIVIFRPLRPIVFLSVLGYYFAYVCFGSLYVYLDLDSWSLCGLYILLWVPL